MKRIYLLVLFSIFLFVFHLKIVNADTPTDLILNEIYVDGTSEWIEVMNPTGVDIDAYNYKIIETGQTTRIINEHIIVPAYGLAVIEENDILGGSFIFSDTGDVISLVNSSDLGIGSVTYGSMDQTGTLSAPNSNQSLSINNSGVYSVTSQTKGWFNDAVDWTTEQFEGTGTPSTPPTLSSLASYLASSKSVLTNLPGPASANPTEATNFYFAKVLNTSGTAEDVTNIVGKMTFAGPLNFTDQNTVNFIKALGSKLDMSTTGGEVKVGMNTLIPNSSTESVFKNIGATITMGGLTSITTAPSLIVKDNSGNTIATSSPNYPTIGSLTFNDTDNTLTFTTNHFTTFETDSKQPTPVFSPAGGAIAWGTTVTISSSGADHIYYTTDGNDPETTVQNATSEYTSPFAVASNTTLKAIAVKTGLSNSNISSATYTQAVSSDLNNIVINGSVSNYTYASSTYTYNGVTVPYDTASTTITVFGSGVLDMSIDGVATTTIASGVDTEPISFTAGVEKTVTVLVIETGKSTKTYTIKITRALNPAKAVTVFGVINQTDVTNINEGNHTISLTMPFGTNVTNLQPSITITGASVSPASGQATDFTNPVIYTVTAEDGTTQNYTVTVSLAPDPDIALVTADKDALIADNIKGGNADLANVTVALTNPLISTGSINNSTIVWYSSATSTVSADGQTINRPDYASGNATVVMTAFLTKGAVTQSKQFTLTVLRLPASTNTIITSATYTIGSGTITDVPFNTSKATFLSNLAKSQINQTWTDTNVHDPVVTGDVLVVTAEDGTTQTTYTVTVNVDPDIAFVASDKSALTDDSIKGGNVDLSNVTLALATLPSSGSNGSTITWASSATSTVSNDGQTITRPVYGAGNATVTLTATITKGVVTDTKQFILTVLESLNSAKAITAFSFSSGTGVINETAHTISVNVPFGTDVTSLVSTFSTTGVGVTVGATGQASGVTSNNFTTPVTYRVTASNGTTEDYVVTVTVLASTQTAPSSDGTATSTVSTPEIVITNPTQAVSVAIDSSTTNPKINVSTFISGGTGTLPAISIISNNANNTTVEIPSSTVITSASTTWDGVISAPTITTVTLPDTSGVTKTLSTAIEVGFSGEKLSFSKAVRLLLPGQAGKRAGYVRTGITFTEITTVCTADTQVAGDALPVDGDCKIDVGSDLVIWTKHFTKFATYSQTINQTGGSSSGGGGIVGLMSNNFYAPQIMTGTTTQAVEPGVGRVLGEFTYWFSNNLRYGMRGQEIIELQKKLTDLGFYNGPITGYFGNLTLKAVKQYQTSKDTFVTGFVGPLTRSYLNGGIDSNVSGKVLGQSTSLEEENKIKIESIKKQIEILLKQLEELKKQI